MLEFYCHLLSFGVSIEGYGLTDGNGQKDFGHFVASRPARSVVRLTIDERLSFPNE